MSDFHKKINKTIINKMRKGGRREDNLTNDVTKFRLDENNELICLNLENRFVNKSGDTKNITDIE